MILTFEIIEKGRSCYGGWNKKQLSVIGVNWPPQKGWKYGVVGNNYSKKKINLFLKLKKTKEQIDNDKIRFEAKIEEEFSKQNEDYIRNIT